MRIKVEIISENFRQIEPYSLLTSKVLNFVFQAEIDAAAELVDFFRFNAYFGKELTKYQPISEDPNTTLNLMRYRPLEGFVASVSPFNFTAIAGNLAYTPAMMVNISNDFSNYPSSTKE